MKKEKNRAAVAGKFSCPFPDGLNKDLGNFLGQLTFHVPKGRKISEYFNFPYLQAVNTETLYLSAKVPFHVDKKRVYQAQMNYQNEAGESVNLSISTNFNLVAPRDACLDASLQYNHENSGVRP